MSFPPVFLLQLWQQRLFAGRVPRKAGRDEGKSCRQPGSRSWPASRLPTLCDV